ncbi:hypothetical protein ABS755_00820 [Castellaniella sp. FW104-16D08]|uniref:hypothetical protein n=1 Tax=unclassified Castellaniella TaxID=2617606 RepID=UPI003315C452
MGSGDRAALATGACALGRPGAAGPGFNWLQLTGTFGGGRSHNNRDFAALRVVAGHEAEAL